MASSTHPFPPVAGVTPQGIAGFAKFLYEPDTHWGTPGSYQIEVAFDPSNPVTKAWLDDRMSRHKKCGGKVGEGSIKKGNKEYKQDPELVYVRFKSKRRPTIVDTAKNDITGSEIRVFGGDTVRIAFKDNPNDQGKNKGCFLYLNRVQLITSNQTPNVDFDDDVTGFVANEQQRASSHEPTEGGAEEGQTDDDGDF